MSENNIAKQIINDARESARLLVMEAKVRAANDLLNAKRRLAEVENERIVSERAELEATLTRAQTLAELDARQKLLDHKYNAINTVFENAKIALQNLKTSEYTKLIKSLIINNCKNGDTVIVCKADEKRITAEFIKAVATSCKLKLTREVRGDFNGGIIFSNDCYDLTLTIDELCADFRNKNEIKISHMLYGE